MSKRSYFSRLLLGGTVAALLSSTAAFAQSAAFDELRQGVINGLNGIGVDGSSVDGLSMARVAELSTILGTSDPDTDKKDAAEKLIAEAKDPDFTSMNSDGAKEMARQLKVAIEGAGLTYPDKQFTFEQTQELLAAFQTEGQNVTGKATAIFNRIMNPGIASTSNEGAMELERQLVAHLQSAGIDVPDWNTLTFSQVSELASIFDQTSKDSEKKAAAMVVLGIN